MKRVFYKGADCLSGFKFASAHKNLKDEASYLKYLNVSITNQSSLEDLIPFELLDANESYNLTIANDTIEITA